MTLTFEKIETNLKDVFLIKREIFNDERGDFSKTYNKKLFEQIGVKFDVKESVYSYTKKNVLRGMHFQKEPFKQAKIINVIEGEILDVIIRIDNIKDKNKPNIFFKKLSKDNQLSLYVPEDYAHGYLTLSNYSIVSYICSSHYNVKSEVVINYDSFGFDWPNLNDLILSKKDQNGANYNDL